jgi:hypothetical protein
MFTHNTIAPQFVAKAGDKATTAKDRALDRSCSSLLQKICQKYDNLAEVDKLAAVAKKVDSVKLVMQENVDIALQNCVKLESIERAAEELQQQAGVFKRNANELKKKMWWKNIKMKLIIAAIVLVIIGIIVAVIVVMVRVVIRFIIGEGRVRDRFAPHLIPLSPVYLFPCLNPRLCTSTCLHIHIHPNLYLKHHPDQEQ